MKITPEYNNNAFIVPGSVVELLCSASQCPPLEPLMYALSHKDFSASRASSELGIGEDEFTSSLVEWEKLGVISLSGKLKRTTSRSAKRSADTESEKHKKVLQHSTLPTYTTEETARFLEGNSHTAEIIDSCENIIGKIFTTAETGIIVGLLDHLSLTGEYILLLFAHAKKMGKDSVRYIERLAIDLVDRDITTYASLEEELSRTELTESTVGHVRTLFGLGSRALTKKEHKMVRDWCITWSFDSDVISKAYEITANSTGSASIPYANAILSNWHDAGLKTAEDVDAYIEASRKDQSNRSADGKDSSFDTDDFFEAALKRSYGE